MVNDPLRPTRRIRPLTVLNSAGPEGARRPAMDPE